MSPVTPEEYEKAYRRNYEYAQHLFYANVINMEEWKILIQRMNKLFLPPYNKEITCTNKPTGEQ